jgi:membrane protein required for colicin V production
MSEWLASANGLDLFALILILLSVLASLWRGAVVEIFSLLGWIASFIVARLYAGDVAELLFSSLQPAALRTALAWVLCFIVVIMCVNIAAAIVKRLVQATGLTPLDRLLGGVAGFFKAGLFLLVLVWFGGYTPLVEAQVWKSSTAVSVAKTAVDVIKQKNGWDQTPKAQPAPSTGKPKPTSKAS